MAWGRNDHGQLGNGTNSDTSVPVPVQGLTKVVAIAGGLNHSLALCEDGTVWAWGHNGSGQLGDGTTTNRNVPTRVEGLTGASRIAAGANHNLALVGPSGSGGVVMAWGDNATGQLGDNSTTNRTTPVRTQDSWTGEVTTIAAGGDHSLAVTSSDSRLHTWGRNTSGQLGDGTTDHRPAPVPVPGLKGIQLVAGGREHTIVLLGDNTVRSWGANGSGQLGNGTTTDSSTPVTTLTALTGVDKIAASLGGDFSLAN
ncbi:RCC1 domain-containing protein [Streptomyces sp. NPDC127110]|uniref:RCC1 domain-containing protein n=1 Tax=Streptomyces sp. NPDC127110 TaxID=3345362 RepID=UPI0036259945